jgi:hypothetical protein
LVFLVQFGEYFYGLVCVVKFNVVYRVDLGYCLCWRSAKDDSSLCHHPHSSQVYLKVLFKAYLYSIVHYELICTHSSRKENVIGFEELNYVKSFRRITFSAHLVNF